MGAGWIFADKCGELIASAVFPNEESQLTEGIHAILGDPLSRAELYELVWREPMLRIAERFGVSSSYMARVCTELRVPRPPRGYWAKLEVGKAPLRPALPEARPGDVTEWKPGSGIGTTERATKRAAQTPHVLNDAKPATGRVIRRKSRRPVPSKSVHPLVVGIKPFFDKTRDSETGILRPFKRLMADLISSRELLDTSIDAADKLFNSLTSRGHRVTIAPASERLRRAEVDLREVPRKDHYLQDPWSPERPTVVYISDVPIGLTLFEMSEVVEMQYVGNSQYVPLSGVTPAQRERYKRQGYWTTMKDVASGRLCLQAYCPSWLVEWTKHWREEKPGQLTSMLPNIVSALEAAGPALSSELNIAKLQAEEKRRQWDEEMQRQREAEARARQEKCRQDARADLLAVIAGWDEARRIEAFFTEVENAIDSLDEGERQKTIDRVSLAKKLLGDPRPLERLLRWRAPHERN